MKIESNCEVHTLPKKLFQNINIDPLQSYELAKIAARQLSEKYDGNVTLCLSGGLDSQAMVTAFVAAKCKFSISILKFNQNLNEHDTEFVKDFCEQMNLSYKIINVDVLDFFESGKYFDIAVQAKTNSPQFALFAWFADQLDAVPVFSGQAWSIYSNRQGQYKLKDGDLLEQVHNIDLYIPALKEYAAENYLTLQNRKCVSHFFSSEETLLKSFWANKYVLNETLADYEIHKSYQFKYLSYLHSGFPLLAPSRMVKLNGFERLLQHYSRRYNSSNHYYFNELFRVPLENMFPKREKIEITFFE